MTVLARRTFIANVQVMSPMLASRPSGFVLRPDSLDDAWFDAGDKVCVECKADFNRNAIKMSSYGR
jgi:hypothetical protein